VFPSQCSFNALRCSYVRNLQVGRTGVFFFWSGLNGVSFVPASGLAPSSFRHLADCDHCLVFPRFFLPVQLLSFLQFRPVSHSPPTKYTTTLLFLMFHYETHAFTCPRRDPTPSVRASPPLAERTSSHRSMTSGVLLFPPSCGRDYWSSSGSPSQGSFLKPAWF